MKARRLRQMNGEVPEMRMGLFAALAAAMAVTGAAQTGGQSQQSSPTPPSAPKQQAQRTEEGPPPMIATSYSGMGPRLEPQLRHVHERCRNRETGV